MAERLSRKNKPPTPTIERVIELHPTIAPQIKLVEWIEKMDFRVCRYVPDPVRPGKGMWMPLGWDTVRVVAEANDIDLEALGREQAVVSEFFGKVVDG